MTRQVRFAFAGDRDIAVQVLGHLLELGHRPQALMLSARRRASDDEALEAMCPFLPGERIFRGKRFRDDAGLAALRELELDYIVGIHFPYIVPGEVLSIPKQGVLNLHPAYLPFNRGWHTPTWAILDDTPIGATLHFMDDGIDTGDIVHQRRLDIAPDDTADTLYRRVKQLELQVFKEAWPDLVGGSFRRTKQDPAAGSSHGRKELFRKSVQRIDLSASLPAIDLLRRLRALTTNDVSESAYFEQNGLRYRVRVSIDRDE